MLFADYAIILLRIALMVQQDEKIIGAFANPSSGAGGGGGANKPREILYEPGDVTIGALFAIHRNNENNCKDIWPEYGIHRIEMALRTIDEINRNWTILPRLKLGIEVRDDCWKERVAVEQTIEFLKDVMDSKIGAQQAQQGCAGSDPQKTGSQAKNLVAVIGPGSSDNSKATHNLLQIFNIPQVGYSATSTDLSNKKDFRYYMRVVPSDAWQARAFVDIVKYFNWTYIAVIYSEGSYGQKGFEELEKRIEMEEDLCIGVREMVKKDATDADFDAMVDILRNKEPRPKVVVCFCLGDDVRKIFLAIKRYQEYANYNASDANFQWIGSESWADRDDVVRAAKEVAIGSLSLRIHSPYIHEFDDYILNLRPETYRRNPWFAEYWEQQFNCSLADNEGEKFHESCDPSNSLQKYYKQDTKLSQVVYSIYTVALALDQMYKDLCENYTGIGLCPAMTPVNGSMLFTKYMMNVRFAKFEEYKMYFDENGDPPARYDIMNYQRNSSQGKIKYQYVKVGAWSSEKVDNATLGIDIEESVQFYTGIYRRRSAPFGSACSAPCGLGQVKKLQTLKCCWLCQTCNETEYVFDEFTCKACLPGQWATIDKRGCYNLTVEYLRWYSVEAAIAIAFAGLGMLTTLLTTVIFIRFNNTPVVKATTRELSYIILAGCFLCYGTTFVIVQIPTEISCYVLRTVPGLAFAMMYGALLTKTNRIARILAGSKKRILTKKPRFLSTQAQVLMTLILIGIESSIITAMLIYQPADSMYDYSLYKRVILRCNTTTLGILGPFGFDFGLIALCTLYAIKTRNLPENFNEAKFIGFTMYTTCIVWLAFVTIYFGSDRKSITMCFCFSLSASVTLVLLFFPKIYIILLQPQKNVRSSYATSKVIRCHFGTTMSQASTVTQNSSRSKSSKGRSLDTSNALHPLKQRGPFKDSVHVPNPRIKKSASADEEKLLLAASAKVNPDFLQLRKSQPSGPKENEAYPGKPTAVRTSSDGVSKVIHKPQLSVIEESNQSSNGSEGVSVMVHGNFRDFAVQTDVDLLEEFLKALRFASGTGGLRRRSHSQREKRERIEPEDSGKFSALKKRTFSEYRKGGRKSVAKQQRDPLPTLVAYRLEQYGSGGNRTFSALNSPLLSPKREPKIFNDLEEEPEIFESEPEEVVNRKISVGPQVNSDLIASTLGSTFATFFGTAVPTAPIDQLYVEVEEDAEPRTQLIHESLEHSFDPLVGPAFTMRKASEKKKSWRNSTDAPGGRFSEGSPTAGNSPVANRKTSFISRLGHSIRKRMRRKNAVVEDEDGMSFDNFNQQQIAEESSASESPKQKIRSSKKQTSVHMRQLHEVIEEVDLQPPQTILYSTDVQRGPSALRQLGSQESDAADSGFHSNSLPSGSQSSKQSGSWKSKHGSMKGHGRILPTEADILSESLLNIEPPDDLIAETPATESKKSVRLDKDQLLEFQELLHGQGIELEISTESTLV